MCHDGRVSKRIIILGVTGSIGRQAVEVSSLDSGVEIVGMSAGSDAPALASLARSAGVTDLAISDRDAASELSAMADKWDVAEGPTAAAELIEKTQPDLVLNAVVGFAGLSATVACLDAGIDLALANKESLVAGGDLVVNLAEANGAAIIPVDSEHAALAQLLEGRIAREVERLTLTASGGPFRGYSHEQLRDVTVEMALNHPTWRMGGKISVDSATMMNKGLETIEAEHLFSVGYDRIGVVVHPQSIVHALVTLVDGVELAHLGMPDMRAPIGWAIGHPERYQMDLDRLDLATVGSLDFEPVDREAFPCLALAEQAGRSGGTAPAILNAANEVAVAAFLEGDLPFVGIAEVVDRTLEELASGPAHDLRSVEIADRDARSIADEQIKEMSVR